MFPTKMDLLANVAVENKRRVCLVWEDLTVVASSVNNSPKRELLKGLSGYAEPNRIMALIGPSGSGKSTVLAALAGTYFSPSLHSNKNIPHTWFKFWIG